MAGFIQKVKKECEWGKVWDLLTSSITLFHYMTTIHTLTLTSHIENFQCEFHGKRAENGFIKRIHYRIVNTIHRQGYPTSLLLPNTELGLPVKVINKKNIWGIVIGKEEIKVSLHTENIVVYKENARMSTNKLLRAKKISRVAGCKANMKNQ